jgi:hypothetical protein
MRKLLLFVFPAIFAIPSAKAQSYKSSYTFQKNLYPVAAIQVPFEEDAVKDALIDYMKAHGYKDAHYKDFIVFRDVPLDKNNAAVSDAYFLVDRKSRSEKDVTVISLLPVKKGETLSPATAEDSSYTRIAMTYLDSLKKNVHSFSLTKLIEAQQKTLDKTKGKMVDLKNDSGDIAKKIRSYESELAQNKIDQENQTKAIALIASGDQASLAKAHKKMDKLMDNQTDYEKKLRNYKADLEKNTEDRQTAQSLFESQTKSLEALKQRHQNLGAINP